MRGWTKETFTEEHKKHISEACKGREMAEMIKEKIRKGNLGKIRSLETRMRISNSKKKDKNPNWKGGISEYHYSKEFSQELKNTTRKKDNYLCQLCGMSEEESLRRYGRVLCVNHIDFDKMNCDENNLDTLCVSCNVGINSNRVYFSDFLKRVQIRYVK